MSKSIVVTGALSQIGKATIPKLLTLNQHLILIDRPEAKWELFGPEQTDEYTVVKLDFSKPFSTDILNHFEIDGMVFMAAAGLLEMSETVAQRINVNAHLQIAHYVEKNFGEGHRGIYINSLWGHNRQIMFHEGYERVAHYKHLIEGALRKNYPSFNYIVASLVDNTFAPVWIKRTQGREGYNRLINEKVPGGELVDINKVADAILEAYLLPEGGQTVFLPASASEFASKELMAISEHK